MSVVERALKKFQNSSGAREAREGREPIARVATKVQGKRSASPADLGDLEGPESSNRFIEFDLEELGRAGLYAAGNSKLSDEYRLIKQPIIRKAASAGEVPGEERTNLIMVASALSGEGKTFTSVNMSLSLASEKDWSVLLVDVDCRNPQLTRLLGAMEQPGLLDYLRDPSASLAPLVLKTNIEGLSVLPTGGADENAAELLASSRMNSLCTNLATKYPHQLVIFDSSPLLLTAESSILASQVGQTVMVVDANHSPRQAVMEAIGKLNQRHSIGLILNRAEERGGEFVGYGTYGPYGYPSR